jgi:cell fate regulator YaaT (PSP1 superfamily)
MNKERTDDNLSFLPRSYGTGPIDKEESDAELLSPSEENREAVSDSESETLSRPEPETEAIPEPAGRGEDKEIRESTGPRDGNASAETDKTEPDTDEEEEPFQPCTFISEADEPPVCPRAGAGPSDGPVAETTPKKWKVKLVGIRFGYACKVYHFEAGDIDLRVDDRVVVKTEKGMGLGRVALDPFERELDADQMDGLRQVIRKAEKSDYDQQSRCEKREAEASAYCLERIETLGLPMKLVDVDCFFDGSKYVFYFTAEGRVDFRELVKQLVARFPVRIEMRQIGVRHEAKMIGGLGCCGQELCCSRFLTDFRPVSVRMAKDQNLSLNPTKISGACGRLMCCLGYEHDIYEDFKKGLPKVGKTVKTSKGDAVVLKYNPLCETISVRTEEESGVEITKKDLIAPSSPTRKPKNNRKGEANKQSSKRSRSKRRNDGGSKKP